MGFWDAPYPGQSIDPGLPPGYAPPQDPLLVAMMGQGAVEPPPDRGGYRQYGGSMVADPDAIAKMDQQPQPWTYGQQWALSRPHTGDPYAGMTPPVPDLPEADFGGGPVAPEALWDQTPGWMTQQPANPEENPLLRDLGKGGIGPRLDQTPPDPKALQRMQELEALGRQLQMQKLEGYDPEAGPYTRPDQRWLGI